LIKSRYNLHISINFTTFAISIEKGTKRTLYYVCQILQIREPSAIGDAQGSRGTKAESIASG
jgi:hypothetical protein